MPNTLLTIGDMSRESLMQFKNSIKFTKTVFRGYDDRFARTGAKIGATANIRLPQIYSVGDGAAITPQDVTDRSVAVVIDHQFHVAISFPSADLTLSVDNFSQRYIQPAMTALANKVDLAGLTLAAQTATNAVGTPGTTPNTAAIPLNAGASLDRVPVPRDERALIMDPTMNASMVDALKGLFNPQAQLGTQFQNGMVAKNTLGFDWHMDQNVYVHTVGPLGGTPLVNGAGQTGATLVTDGWTAAAALRLNKGDRFTIAGVFKVNAQSKQNTGELQVFTVTAAVSSSGAGAATIPISPSIVASGVFQNVSGSPADNATINVIGAANTVTPVNIAHHKNAFALAVVDLDTTDAGAQMSRQSDPDSGLSIRVARQYAIGTDLETWRFDLLCGWAAIRPEMACAIYG